MTDNGLAYRSKPFRQALQTADAHHVRTRPYNPGPTAKPNRGVIKSFGIEPGQDDVAEHPALRLVRRTAGGRAARVNDHVEAPERPVFCVASNAHLSHDRTGLVSCACYISAPADLEPKGAPMDDARVTSEPIRLTSLAHGGGCGCKIAPGVLQEILAKTPASGPFSALLVGTEISDDAAVWKLDANQPIVATTDFFMPMVDDPFYFGRIAATNALPISTPWARVRCSPLPSSACP
jgi:hypothetical protein